MQNALRKLHGEGVIDVVFEISPDANKEFGPKYFSYVPEVVLSHYAQDAAGQALCYRNVKPALAHDLVRFLDLYSRVNYSKGTDFHEHVHLFHLYYHYFTGLLQQRQANVVFFMGAPHVGVDYMLYIAARDLGIPTVLTFQSHIKDRFFCTLSLDDYGVFEQCPLPGAPVEEEVPRTYRKKLDYMVGARPKRSMRPHKLLEDLLRWLLPTRQPISLSGVFFNLANRYQYVRCYRKYVETTVDFNSKYVYFPLQMQPELTTSALGNEYSDQLLAVEKISAMIPDDWHIYVKENPKQSASQRNRFFYERMSRIPNCHYLPETIDTYELIEHSQFVAAITGTVCWEAISGGKPALLFGVSWYMSLPGVFRYSDDLKAETVAGVSFTHEQLQQAYNELMSKTLEGVPGLEYQPDKAGEYEKANDEKMYRFFKALSKVI